MTLTGAVVDGPAPRRATARRRSWLARLFLVLALPTVLIQVYLTPPMQVADEENHFLRALQVADGHAFGHLIGGGNAGGTLDPAAPVFAHAFDGLKFHPEAKLDLGTYGAAAAQRWGGGPAAPAAFPNTAIYPFFLYLPASAGLAAGRAVHLLILDSFYLARLAMALVSTGLAALAVGLCGRGRTLLFVILCCPMALSLFASVSQDAMSIALGALAMALWSRSAAREEPMPARVRAVVALALGAVAAARIPLLPLSVLAVTPTAPRSVGRLRLGWRDAAAAMAGLVPFAIGVYGEHVAKVPFRGGDGVSPLDQLHWLRLHPAEALAVAGRTLGDGAVGYLRELVGVLGWLDTDLPDAFYAWMAAVLLAALLIDLLSPEPDAPGGWRLLPIAGALAAAAGVFAAFDLGWTPVGAPVIEGVQGRYFIVPVLMLAVALPGAGRLGPGGALVLERMRVALCVAVALVDLWVVPITLLHRYYG